jgi:DNA modification methylase
LGQAKEHPAKTNPRLIEFLVSEYSKKGEIVLDVMAGTGSSGTVANLLGRNAVQVEHAKKFARWMDEANVKLAHDADVDDTGLMINIHGDARQTAAYIRADSVDLIVTSPPYVDQNRYSNVASRTKQLARTRTTGVGKEAAERKLKPYYSRSKKNIGNMNVNEYFKAMARVYDQCFKVLKEGKYAAIVVRPLHRNKAVLDLPHETWLLLERSGFELSEVYKVETPRSLFTNMYEKHYRMVPIIHHDYIIVVRKPVAEISLGKIDKQTCVPHEFTRQ